MNPALILMGAILAGGTWGTQAQAPPPAFEVASIRQHTGPLHTMDTTSISGTLVRYQGYSVDALVREAYHLNRYQLSLDALAKAQQDWAYGVYYEIEARAPGGAAFSRDQARVMLQTLLAQRFRLAVHRETKTMPVYILALSKKGSRMAPDPAASRCSGHMSVAQGGQSYAFTGCDLANLAEVLEDEIVDRPVLDRTGLTGNFNYTLICLPLFMQRAHPDRVGLSPFAALEQQLGLKLTPAKAPFPVVIVTHLEPPTAN